MRFTHISLALAVPAALLAQQADLTGRWVLNEAESRYPGPRSDGARSYIPAAELVISVDGVTITVDSRMSRATGASGTNVRTITADGGSHTSVTESGDSVTSVSRWEGGILTDESERVVLFGMRRMTFSSVRKYFTAEENSKLRIEEQIRNPDGSSLAVTLVYERRR